MTFLIDLFYLAHFQVHPRCSMYQYFVLFYGWIIFHCRHGPQFVCSFIHWWTFGLFHLQKYSFYHHFIEKDQGWMFFPGASADWQRWALNSGFKISTSKFCSHDFSVGQSSWSWTERWWTGVLWPSSPVALSGGVSCPVCVFNTMFWAEKREFLKKINL